MGNHNTTPEPTTPTTTTTTTTPEPTTTTTTPEPTTTTATQEPTTTTTTPKPTTMKPTTTSSTDPTTTTTEPTMTTTKTTATTASKPASSSAGISSAVPTKEPVSPSDKSESTTIVTPTKEKPMTTPTSKDETKTTRVSPKETTRSVTTITPDLSTANIKTESTRQSIISSIPPSNNPKTEQTSNKASFPLSTATLLPDSTSMKVPVPSTQLPGISTTIGLPPSHPAGLVIGCVAGGILAFLVIITAVICVSCRRKNTTPKGKNVVLYDANASSASLELPQPVTNDETKVKPYDPEAGINKSGFSNPSFRGDPSGRSEKTDTLRTYSDDSVNFGINNPAYGDVSMQPDYREDQPSRMEPNKAATWPSST